MYSKTYDEMTDWERHFLTGLVREDFDAMFAVHTDGPEAPYEISVKIHGVEVGFSSFIALLERNYDRSVAEAARELVDEKFGPLREAFDNVSDILSDAESKVRKELGIEKDSWDY